MVSSAAAGTGASEPPGSSAGCRRSDTSTAPLLSHAARLRAERTCLTPPASCPTCSLPSFYTVQEKRRRGGAAPAAPSSDSGGGGVGFSDAGGLSGGGGGGIVGGRVRRLIRPRTLQAALGRRSCHGAGTYLCTMHFLKDPPPRQTVGGSDLFCRRADHFPVRRLQTLLATYRK